MSNFRHPRTQNERKAERMKLYEEDANTVQIKGRVRSGKKGKSLPTERDDRCPAAAGDRSRGKRRHR
ncbi:MAG TPA: hypothetical protein ENJ60_15260 [Aeromonadales bacterium]|nr:hypothetical protein [Aeromonadales bacterium]